MAEKMDEAEVQFLSPNGVVNGFRGEDLCERANICRRNNYNEPTIPLNDYNEGFIERMVNKEPEKSNKMMSDYEIESMVQSVIDAKGEIYSTTSSDDKSDDDIEDLEDESEVSKWTSNVLKKPREEDFFDNHFTSIRDLEDCLYSCVAFNNIAVEPYDTVPKASSFYKSFTERLKRLKCRDFRLELFLWPNIIKNISVSCVSNPKSGKTNSYLVPLMNWFDSKEVLADRDSVTIGAIVLCGSTRQTYEIARLAKQWRDPKVPQMEQTIRILSMNSTNEQRLLTSILNGCDILVTTPGPLLRAIETSIIDCSSTRALIIDDGDITLSLHGTAVRQIYLSYAKMKKGLKRYIQKNGTVSNPMAFQTMIFSQKWTEDVQWFSREVQHKPNFVFGSFYELSIALKVECRVEVIQNENCREKAVKLLVKNALNEKQLRIAIVCRNEDEISFLRRHMREDIRKAKLIVIEVSHSTPHYDLELKRSQWNKHRNGTLLFITEEAIKIVAGFQDCYSIIHYKLPNNFDDFGERFRLMTKLFKKCKTPFDTKDLPHLKSYVVVCPTDSHIPELISYLNRLKADVSKDLLSMGENRQKLCINFCSFGRCPFGPVYCQDRHRFTEKDTPLPSLPQRGQIKIILTYVMGANLFYFRLQEYRNESHTSGQWCKMDVTYDDIRHQLNEFKDMAYNTVNCVDVHSTVYGISVRGEVLRVTVLRIVDEKELQYYEEYDPKDKSQKVELFCIDFGHKLYSKARQLFELPEKLKNLPPFAYKAYLFGIKPVDNEIEWDFRATQKFYEMVDNYRITQITAWILKQVDGVFWLNRMNVEKRLKNANLKVESNPIKHLIEAKYVEPNECRLPDVNTDYYRIVNIWHNYRLNSAAYHSCLVDDTSYVVVTDFVSLNEIYVMHESRVKRLQELEDKWLSTLPSLQPLIEVSDNQICFYKGVDATTKECFVNRAKVIAIEDNRMDVFLVDHGETVRKVQRKSLFKIGEQDLKELPFQAIKVSLFGVEEVQPISYDLICELTRDDSDRYLMAIAEKQSYDNNRHTVRLFVAQNSCETHFVSLSKRLVDMDFAQFVDGEEDNEMELIIEKEIIDPNEESESEYMESLEEQMKDNLCKDIAVKVYESLGFSDPLSPPTSTQLTANKESRASKTARRLKAITAKSNGLKNDETDDESEDENRKPFAKKIIPNTGDFDYELDPNTPLMCYDPSDTIDDNCDYSDEEGILEEEEFT